MIVTIAIGLGLGLIGLGVLGMLISGIQSLIKGKQDVKKILMMLVPFAVFAVAFGIFSDVAQAGVATMIFMIAAMLLLIFLSGLRGTFNI
ncbi:hypothetical protein [Fodinibius sediminis]|uniref:Uncharacterized protein n=1 Tax=Fodinibius sediminis TaxID=1214077 RepID=A0A521B987_9BACT|nr:hypothetical protein [Fodinibius sediminis]SMO43656.1 hypothetical protein SAMN06265218_102318 [Fodinibius sediminis]